MNTISRRTLLGFAIAAPFASAALAQPVKVVRIATTGYVRGGKLEVGGTGARGAWRERAGWKEAEKARHCAGMAAGSG